MFPSHLPLQPELSTTPSCSALRKLLVKHCVGSDTFEDELEAHSNPVRTSLLQKQVRDSLSKSSTRHRAEAFSLRSDEVNEV